MKNKPEIAVYIILGALVLFGVIGWMVTPKDEHGQPILLLPDVKNVEEYRKKAIGWTEDLQLLDGRLAVLLSGNPQSLYTQSRNSQDLFADYVKITQEIENAESPAALTGLKDDLLNTATSYLNACQSALIWVSDPTNDNLVSTEAMAKEAKTLLKELEQSTWTN